MQYLNIPDKRLSIFDKQNDFEINSDMGRIDNVSDFSVNTQKQEILSEKNDRDEKEVNIREILEKMNSLNAEQRLFLSKLKKNQKLSEIL
jgi:hypothetical protein